MLPSRPNLEYLRKMAKARLEELRHADPSARLADAQLAVAREHGFASWRKLRAHLDSLRSAADPSPEPAWPEALMEEFFGAIRRGDETALQRMLAAEPGLANARHADGTTPLLAAAETSHTRVIELLLSRGRTPSEPTRTRPTRRCRGR